MNKRQMHDIVLTLSGQNLGFHRVRDVVKGSVKSSPTCKRGYWKHGPRKGKQDVKRLFRRVHGIECRLYTVNNNVKKANQVFTLFIFHAIP